MAELIDRQAAIDWLMKEWKAYKGYPYPSHVEDGLAIALAILGNKLPSAQPEIIRCEDCVSYGEMLAGRDKRMICHKFALNFPRDFYCAYAERRTNG